MDARGGDPRAAWVRRLRSGPAFARNWAMKSNVSIGFESREPGFGISLRCNGSAALEMIREHDWFAPIADEVSRQTVPALRPRRRRRVIQWIPHSPRQLARTVVRSTKRLRCERSSVIAQAAASSATQTSPRVGLLSTSR